MNLPNDNSPTSQSKLSFQTVFQHFYTKQYADFSILIILSFL